MLHVVPQPDMLFRRDMTDFPNVGSISHREMPKAKGRSLFSGGAEVSIQNIPKHLPGYRPKKNIPNHQVMDPSFQVEPERMKKASKKPPSSSSRSGALPRSERALIVKQIMAQRGVGMIEASKIVKREGLY